MPGSPKSGPDGWAVSAAVTSSSMYYIRGTPALFTGTVEAPDEATAIKMAIEEFQISDLRVQKQLIAQRAE
jgi:hypothetical protein